MKIEYKVGIFVAIGLLIFAYLVLWLGTREIEIFKKEGYILKTRFSSLAGLEKNSSVRLAGVRVGRVRDIDLKEGMAEITMFIYKDVKIREESKASVSSMGIMGEKYVEIFPGPPNKPFLKENSYIDGIQPLSIDQIGQTFYSIGVDIKSVGKILRDAFTYPTGENKIKDLISNIDALSENLKELSRALNSDYPELKNSTFALTEQLNSSISKITSGFEKTTKEVNSLLVENKDEIKKSLENLNLTVEKAENLISELEELTKRIKDGKGLASKVINDPEFPQKIEDNLEELRKTLEDSRSTISTFKIPELSYGARGEYLSSNSLVRGYLTISAKTGSNRFLEGEILREPWDNKIKFSFLGKLSYRGIFAKAGFIESSFGLGVGFQPLKNLEISIESLELNRRPRPIFRAYTRFYPFSNIFLVAGVEDFALKEKTQLYFGLGFKSK
ncbi:MAG: MlaD family protein [Candidatus Aminicenantia bacterium]